MLRIALLLPKVFSGDQLRDLGGEEGLQSKEAFFLWPVLLLSDLFIHAINLEAEIRVLLC